MQELEPPLSFIHPNSRSGALVYLAILIVLGVAGSFVVRGVARRMLLLDKVGHMAVAIL